MREQLSPKQVGLALGVSEASIKRWCDKGTLETFRTAGGHRRLSISSVLAYIRESGHQLIRPEVLGLPPTTGQGERQISRIRPLMRDALAAGDDAQFRRLAFNLYLGGTSCHEIFDHCIAEAFHELGDRWQHGVLEIYQERRACEICLRLLHELRMSVPAVPDHAPLALGGTLSGDHYSLATTMAEIVLRESGWRAESYGLGLPAETLCAAIEEEGPRLVWLSVSYVESRTEFLEQYDRIYKTASARGVAVAVGGRALDPPLRKSMRYATFCDQLQHLAAFAMTVAAA